MPDADGRSTTFIPGAVTAELIIDRPRKRNPISAQVLKDVVKALDHCSAAGKRVLVLRGAAQFFSSGADLAEVTGTPEDGAWFDLIGRVTSRLASDDVVSIAAIEGGCLGSALDLAAACDLRVSARDAYFGLPALEMGVVYRPATFRRIAGLAGPTTVARLAVLGERITAIEAQKLGLVTQLAEDATAVAHQLADRLASLPIVALRETVRMIGDLADSVPVAEAWTRAHQSSLASHERRIAVSAKRASIIKGTA